MRMPFMLSGANIIGNPGGATAPTEATEAAVSPKENSTP